MNDLLEDSAGWDLIDAYAINDAGEIVGYGKYNDETREYKINSCSRTILFFDVIQRVINSFGKEKAVTRGQCLPISSTTFRRKRMS